MTFSGKRFY